MASSQNLDLSGLDRTVERLRRLSPIPDEEWIPLVEQCARTMIEDNRKGILEGTDKDGQSMPPVTYRPKPKAGFPLKNVQGGAKPTAPRAGGKFGLTPSGAFRGAGPHRVRGTVVGGLHNNLTTEEYEQLDGPPLAPRYHRSRVITNFKVGYNGEVPGSGRQSSDEWAIVGLWDEVLDDAGQPFLLKHFTGIGKLPKRDLRGVRPWGMAEMKRVFGVWAQDLLSRAIA